MLAEYLTAVGLIFIAEMGDKTQILAMAFATKYKVKQVLFGIFIGSFLNHGLAVVLGSALSTVVPVEALQIIAGISFVGFALWTLKLDEESEEETKYKYGPILTVALAFFIGELGDKTQLTAIVLSTDAQFPILILLGTVTGMVITGGLGIYVGSKLGAKIPEFTIKLVSAAVFMMFGMIKLSSYLPKQYLSSINILVFVIVIIIAVYFILKPTLQKRKMGTTAFQKSAQRLYDFYNELHLRIEDICLGEAVCGNCSDSNCIIGATKYMLKENKLLFEVDYQSLEKSFDRIKVVRSLERIIEFLEENEGSDVITNTRENLENILFGTTLTYNNRKDYLNQIAKIDIGIRRLFK